MQQNAVEDRLDRYVFATVAVAARSLFLFTTELLPPFWLFIVRGMLCLAMQSSILYAGIALVRILTAGVRIGMAVSTALRLAPIGHI